MLRTRLAGVLLATVAAAALAVTQSHTSAAAAASGPWFGVLNADGQHASQERAAHVSVAALELNWSAYEPSNGSFDSSYVADRKARLQTLTGAGQNVILDLGMQYPPSWVFSLDGNTRFVNQYGDVWHSGISEDVPNSVFDQTVRAAQAAYISRVAADFGDSFYAIRAGGLLQDELRYPPTSVNGHSNAYWAFDGAAQAGSPVPGWKPGQADTSKAAAFMNYYLDSLVNYQNWLLGQYRSHFASAWLQVLMPSWGIRPGDVEAAVARNLDGTTNAASWGTLSMGLDWQRQVNALSDTHVMLYATWLERGDDGSTANTMGPGHYVATLAASKGLPAAGENAGGDSAAQMSQMVDNARAWGLVGMMWLNESDLVGNVAGGWSQLGSSIAAGAYQMLAQGSSSPAPSTPPASTPPASTPPASAPPATPGPVPAGGTVTVLSGTSSIEVAPDGHVVAQSLTSNVLTAADGTDGAIPTLQGTYHVPLTWRPRPAF